MALEITEAVLAAQSADASIRTAAESSLRQFQDENLPLFLRYLSAELANDQNPPASRRLAGIRLKNCLEAEDSVRKQFLIQHWIKTDPTIKSRIKESLLQTLASPVSDARNTASQVTAKVASIEIPRKDWEDLIPKLSANMANKEASPSLKQGTLETLGYVCEEISPSNLEQDQVNAVLTAVVQGMSQSECGFPARLAAVRALYNALGFASTNFKNEIERNYIMKVICETAISQEADIRQAADECLVSIASSTRLRGSAYETLSEVIRCANIAENTNLIAQLLIEMLKRIGRTMEAEIMPSEKQRELQALLCGIQVIIQTLNGCEESKPVILQSADQMMAVFLRVGRA